MDMAMADAAKPPIRLVIFDFDGTLSDSGEWFLTIVDDLARKFRFRTVDPSEIDGLRDRSTREVIRHLGIPAWKLPFIAAHVRKRVARNTDKIHLFAGVPEMIQALAESGVKIALVTSNAEGNARAILGPVLSARISWYECGSGLYGKAPKFRRVLKRSRIAPDQVIAIGDETRDIEAARRVGIRTGAVLWGYASQTALERFEPDAFFTEPMDIVSLVTRPRPVAVEPVEVEAVEV